MVEQVETDLLNDAQRNSLAIGLRAFEMHLRQAMAWLEDGEETGILYRRRLTLPAERRAAMRRQIAVALALIAVLAERFNLAPAEEALEASIAAQLSVDWANLSDLRSDKLRRYGDVDPRLAALLDADIADLASRALALAAACRAEETP
jgi:hypothetical protein